MSAADKAELNLSIFSTLMPYWNEEDIDSRAIAEEFKMSQQKVASMIRSAKTTDRAYRELIAMSYRDDQIAPWCKRPPGVTAPTVTPLTPLEGPLTPLSLTGATPNTEETPSPGNGDTPLPTDVPLTPLSTTVTPLEGALTPLDTPLTVTPNGSQLPSVFNEMRIQSDRLKTLGIITDANGRHVRASVGPDGKPGFQVATQAEVDEITQSITTDVATSLSLPLGSSTFR